MLVEFSEKDILRSKIVEPAWYRVRIEHVETALAKSGKTTNIRLDGVIIKNADTGDEKFAGVPTPFLWFFNSGAIGAMIPLLTAVDPTLEITPGFRVNTGALEGKELEMFIGNGIYNNNTVNVITNQYRAVQS